MKSVSLSMENDKKKLFSSESISLIKIDDEKRID